ncbi:MAG: nucleotidyltransferase domain-containing protein [Candidatus Nanosalina sp.]
MDHGQIEEDFSFLKDDDGVLAVLLYGSQVTGGSHERSDVDICIVAPEAETHELMRKVLTGVNTEKKNYDVHTFEELPLYIQHRLSETTK